MKQKKIVYILLSSVLIGLLIVGYYVQHYNNNRNIYTQKENIQNNKVKLVIDTENKDVLPKNFRTTKDKIDSKKLGDISIQGLADLNISGSGALSEKSLRRVKEKIGVEDIMDIDLRQEDHGFVNGMGISWFGENDQANKGIPRDTIISDEKSKLNEIIKNNYVSFDKLPKGKSINTISEINNPKSVQTEEELAKSLGMNYLRITVTDHEKPLDDQVDLFVETVRNLSQGTWLHFHCRGGAGRTTTFMAMYDMMKNSKNVSFNDIMKRQNLIGGSDLLSGEDEDGTQDRLDFMNMFYNYCKENQNGFQTSWSQWKENEK
ncbi:phosphatase domain-containing putative toxin [Clostridium butyricum]|uniref:phosphatase domain-containing putative toxin n=1 Tax=Clostridium butyricum TaxID=1492 RepID=UPI0018AA7B2C|nr:protein tyrosine phosphatase [Clostridium butyricum]MDB2156188.1 protein tyrosine phosphatase [Clostridium butyricum]